VAAVEKKSLCASHVSAKAMPILRIWQIVYIFFMTLFRLFFIIEKKIKEIYSYCFFFVQRYGLFFLLLKKN